MTLSERDSSGTTVARSRLRRSAKVMERIARPERSEGLAQKNVASLRFN